MACLMEIAIAVVAKIGEYTVVPVGRQLGYLIFYGSNVNNLRSQNRDLEATKASLQHTINQATRRGEVINEIFTNWLADADDISDKATKFLKDNKSRLAKARCSSGNYFFPNMLSRYGLSREAKKIAQSVSEIKDACTFDNGVSYIPILRNIIEIEGHYMELGTRSSTEKRILEALRNDEIRSIGVYGIAGIGKTTLVKSVAKEALRLNLFSDAVEVTVSQNPNLEKIQKEIAERLGLRFDKDGLKERALELRNRLRKEKKFLIILDDVWKKLHLLDIGIALDDDPKGFKILLTSRSQGVLRDDMGVENNFEVALLSEGEAWDCFQNIVGNDLLSRRDINPLATQIVIECACLPLAIVTVAGALKNKTLLAYWEDALGRLQSSTIDERVYTSIRLSYDFLANKEAQMIFLLCSLREEDANISIHELLHLVIGWGLLKDVYLLEAARYRLEVLLDRLKSYGLLSIDDDCVKMHDVVRDVGIRIGSEIPNNMHNIRCNDELKAFLDSDKLKDAEAISLGANYEDQSLPPRLKCPKLLLLWMGRKNSLLPDNFFEETKELRILDLSYLHLKPLPSSFCFLQNLQALHLRFANLRDINLIGELRKLKVLDLGGSTLKRLAEQIGQLSRLQVLNLGNCSQLKVIPPNVISRLVDLEELNMQGSFSNWRVEGVVNGNENNASLSEIKNLAKLTTLFLHIPEANMLPQDLFNTNLKRFYITLGAVWSRQTLENSRTLQLGFNISRLLKENGFKMLLKMSEKLYIDEFNGLKNLVFELDREEGLPQLKYLVVRFNNDIQYIVESMEHDHSNPNVLPRLETFALSDMDNLEKICIGELTGPESLGKLREANVEVCHKLKSLLPLSIAKKLEKIEVKYCKTIKEVVTYSVDHDHSDSIEFPKLKKMILKNLPMLVGFWSECKDQELLSTSDITALTPLFNEKVAFPDLESLELWKLNFERIWSETSCNYKLQNLRHLDVGKCRSLKFLFSSPIARSLSQLERLAVDDCRDMEEILLVVNSDDQLAQVDHKIKFPKLKALKLKCLPNELIKFCSESDNQDQINSASAATPFFNPKVVGFPSLETLEIWGVNTERLWLPDHQLAVEAFYNSHLQNLRELDVKQCYRLKFLFSIPIARSLSQLEQLAVDDCRDMEEIILVVNSDDQLAQVDHKTKFPKLKALELKRLPNELIKFCSESDNQDQINSASAATPFFNPKVVGFPSLETLKIWDVNTERLWLPDHQLTVEAFYNSHLQNLRKLDVKQCDRLKYLFSFSIAQCLVQLQDLNVEDCRDMEEIVFINYEEFPYNSGLENNKLLLKLQNVYLRCLPKLTRFCSSSTSHNIVNCGQNIDVWLWECPNLFVIDDIDKQENHDDQDKVGYAHEERLNHPFAAASFCLSNITKLAVNLHVNSEYLMSASLATSFVHLKELYISRCESMKEVVVTKEFREGKNDLFPSLKYIELADLPELERFCRGYNNMEYLLNLKNLIIESCHKLTTFISNSTNEEPQQMSRQPLFHDQKDSDLPQIVQHGDHEEFFSNLVMLNIIDDVPKLLMDILGSHQYRARTTIFQNLECLQLERCLKKLLMPSWVCFQALTVLIVKSCDGMEYLLTPSTAKSLQVLRVMEISDCNKMREIIHAKDDDDDEAMLEGSSSGSLNNNIVFHHLEFLVLNRLTSLTCFHSGNYALEFPKLTQLVVAEMRNFCDHVLVTAPKLRFFIAPRTIYIPIDVELDSNDHVQVKWDLDHVRDTEQLMEGGGDDKYIDINTPIRHLWEKCSAL